jgi:hypothetical protein
VPIRSVCISSRMYAATDFATALGNKSPKKRAVSARSEVSAPLACFGSRMHNGKAFPRSLHTSCLRPVYRVAAEYRPSPPPRRSDRGEAAVASRPRPSLRTPRVPHCLRSRARLERSSIHACRVPRTRQAVLGGCCSVEGERVIWLPSPARARRPWRRRRGRPADLPGEWTHEVGGAATTRYGRVSGLSKRVVDGVL